MNALPTAIGPGAPAVSGRFRFIFFGPNGVRAGWRVLLFLTLMLPLLFLIQSAAKLSPALKAAAKNNLNEGVSTPLGDIVLQGSALIAMLAAALIMSKIERRPFATYGLAATDAFGRLFWKGALWGVATEALTLALIAVFGGFSIESLALNAGGIVKYAIAWAVAFSLVALQEEFFYRGYLLYTLSSGICFWPAAVLTSAVFGGVHLLNSGENRVGAAGLAIWALVMCLTVRGTGTLWFAVGFNAADDFAETFLFSVKNSGQPAQGQLLHSTMHGPAWLSGGTVGPEASIFSFVAILLFAFLFHLAYKRVY